MCPLPTSGCDFDYVRSVCVPWKLGTTVLLVLSTRRILVCGTGRRLGLILRMLAALTIDMARMGIRTLLLAGQMYWPTIAPMSWRPTVTTTLWLGMILILWVFVTVETRFVYGLV